MEHHAVAIDSRDILEIGRIFAPVIARHSSLRLRLFGSRARGDARRTSDIDLAVNANGVLPAAEMAQLREALEESRVPFRIDLVDYATVSPEMRTAIDGEGVAWPG